MDKLIEKHLIWVITTLVSIGIFVATVGFQEQAIAELKQKCVDNTIQINKIEKCVISLTLMQDDIKEIKGDIREIKRLIYKPAFSVDITKTAQTNGNSF